MNKKKEIIRTIRNFKRILKSGNVKTILVVSDWDIYIKTYTIEEIAARFLRIKGYNVQITISDNTEHPSYQFGYIPVSYTHLKHVHFCRLPHIHDCL